MFDDGGDSIRRWLQRRLRKTEPSTGRGGQWRRSRATSGYDCSGRWWPVAGIGDNKGGGSGGGGECVLFFMKLLLNSGVGEDWGQGKLKTMLSHSVVVVSRDSTEKK